MNKKFVIDFDLDDKNYRQKLDKLMGEASRMGDKMSGGKGFQSLSSNDNMSFQQMRMREMERSFNQQFSRAQVELSKRRVSDGPYSGMATQQDHKIVQQAEKFDKFNKLMDESHKWNKMTHYEERNRHREYRSLSTRQLEVDVRKMRRDATKDERGKRYESADEKRRDVAAMEGIIQQRKGAGSDPTTQAIRQFGKNFFMNQAVQASGALMGKGGQTIAHGAQAGMNAMSMSRMAGMGLKKAGGIGLIVAALDTIFGSLGSANEANKQAIHQGAFVGGGGRDTQKRRFSGWYDGEYGDKFSAQGLGGPDDVAGMLTKHASSGIYGGTEMSDLFEQVYAKKSAERALGVTGDMQDEYSRTGKYGNRQNTQGAILGYAQFLESKKVGDIKVGMDSKGNLSDRNLARLPEYLKRLVELNEGMYKVTGEKSKDQQESAMRYMGSILGLGGIFKDAGVASETASGIRSGFANPKDAMHQYKNVRAYRMGTGNTGVVGMMEAFENMDDPRVINQYMKNLGAERGIKGGIGKNAGYNELAYLRDLQDSMGFGSLTKARKFHNQFTQQGGMRNEDLSKFTEQDPIERLATAAESLTGVWEQRGSKISEMIGKFAMSFLKGIENFISAIETFGKWISDFGTMISDFWAKINSWNPFGPDGDELQKRANTTGVPQVGAGLFGPNFYIPKGLTDSTTTVTDSTAANYAAGGQ